MHASQYRKIAEHPLRQVLRNVVVDKRDLPSKSELRQAIADALPEGTDAQIIDALFTRALEAARTAATDPGSRFDLRGSMDRLTLHVIETMEAADRILPADEEQVDAAEVAKQATALSGPEAALQAIESQLPDSAAGF